MKPIEVLTPIIVLMLVGAMVVPLGPTAIDILQIINLMGAVTLFLTAFYITEPLSLSALPSILLVATLYRLSLNVSTTRAILGNGDGGKMVSIFGHLVVGGNILVGTIIFIIITIVQLLVVAKGAERVAEVSARFALDALPGRQMAIDADVRAGLIDFEGARKKRIDLQSESRFYGALDGTMKFVKGDAIVGILIVCINAIGGLALGIIKDSLSLTEALTTYTTLTVGDGLLSQVPSLLNSIAAGIIVTRVSKDSDTALAGELFGQLFQFSAIRYALLIGLVLLGFVPGVPLVPVLLISGVYSTFIMMHKNKNKTVSNEVKSFRPRFNSTLSLECSEVLSKDINFKNSIESARQKIFEETGVIIPTPLINTVSEKNMIAIYLRGNLIEKILYEENLNVKDGLFSVFEKITLELIDDTLTRKLLDLHDNLFPELISSAVPGTVTVTQLTQILKALVKDQISIRNIGAILQAIVEVGNRGVSLQDYIQESRIYLKREISQKLKKKHKQSIKAIKTDPILDFTISKYEKDGRVLDIEIIRELIDYIRSKESVEVILTSRVSRKVLSDYLLLNKLQIEVIANEELIDVEVDVIGTFISSRNEDLIESLAA